VIRVNDEHFVPIVTNVVKPVTINQVKYIPVKSAPETLEVNRPILPV